MVPSWSSMRRGGIHPLPPTERPPQMLMCMIWVDRHDQSNTWEPTPLSPPDCPTLVVSAGMQAAPTAVPWILANDISAVIVLSRPDALGAARYFGSVLSGRLPWLRIAVRASAAGKMPSMVLGARVLQVGLPAVETLAAFDSTLRTTDSGAWVSSVARLKAPTPSFGQYLRSLLPGPGTVVSQTPELTIRDRSWRQPTPPSPGTRLLISQASSIPTTLMAAFHGAQAEVVPIDPHMKEAYGSRGVEFLVLEPLLSRPTPAHTTCPACRDALFSPTCPYCHVVSRRSGAHA